MYYLFTQVFDKLIPTTENFDVSTVPLSSIVTLAKLADKFVGRTDGSLIIPTDLNINGDLNLSGNLNIEGTTNVNGIVTSFNPITLSGGNSVGVTDTSGQSLNNFAISANDGKLNFYHNTGLQVPVIPSSTPSSTPTPDNTNSPESKVVMSINQDGVLSTPSVMLPEDGPQFVPLQDGSGAPLYISAPNINIAGALDLYVGANTSNNLSGSPYLNLFGNLRINNLVSCNPINSNGNIDFSNNKDSSTFTWTSPSNTEDIVLLAPDRTPLMKLKQGHVFIKGKCTTTDTFFAKDAKGAECTKNEYINALFNALNGFKFR